MNSTEFESLNGFTFLAKQHGEETFINMIPALSLKEDISHLVE